MIEAIEATSVNTTMSRKLINLRSLKRLVSERLLQRSALREVLLQEKDEITSSEFFAKVPIWLVLLRHEGREE